MENRGRRSKCKECGVRDKQTDIHAGLVYHVHADADIYTRTCILREYGE